MSIESDPRKFFENHVRRNYDAWMADLLEEYLAKNAVSDANNMAERVFYYWQSVDSTRLLGVKNVAAYRTALVAECPDFSLVRDVADAHKHFKLDRASRRITLADQTRTGALGFGEGGYGEGVYGGGPQLIVECDDGAKRALSSVVKNVIDMWERLLTEWKL